jgi:NAD(P)-dependent dehydrogenase (short-subunit alcohol dehydrogenase family)
MSHSDETREKHRPQACESRYVTNYRGRMELSGAVTIVTGAASGIGKAGAIRFAVEGAKVCVVDRNQALADATAAEINQAGGTAISVTADVADEKQVEAAVAQTRDAFGPIDLVWSNAGIGMEGGPELPTSEWQRIWDINVMAHVHMARAVLPEMLERGSGYLLSTASAAGLLSNIGTAPYSVTKHGAVAFAEWCSITYGDRGIKVSCLCPQGVDTPLVRSGFEKGGGAVASVLASGTLLTPEFVAGCVVDTIRAETFLVLPHPEVLTFMQKKTADYDRWLGGMRRLQARSNSK